ncbi:hypothetical protein A2697_03290 [Candidatus Curtissbacteria bacterium RIFCSPHIGHO2_01_FULL_41_44]|nr:MAG: hypothetical protein A2697_03290 [Candidatus Curtissbacteria bacterium RIFCSPHIGHO2_01_FULL_41_44]OGE03415.1 MAG: hypothetical protein A3G16_01665 [Candidatus Curtissbacteria bacterium RIFCSPLOWO2_12_FULL_41_16]
MDYSSFQSVMIRLSAKDKLSAVKEVLERGRTLAQVSRGLGCTRQTLATWIRRYRACRSVNSLKGRYLRGAKHPKSLGAKLEKRVLEIIVCAPSFSVHEIGRELLRQGYKVSTFGIWRILTAHNLQVRELREKFSLSHPARTVFAHKLTPAYRVRIIEEYLKEGGPVAAICRNWQISRPTFYKWLRRYKSATTADNKPGLGKLQTGFEEDQVIKNVVKALARRYKRGYEHHRSIGAQTREIILDIVRANPALSVHKIYAVVPKAAGRPIATHVAIQNLLFREGLNTRTRREQFAEGYLTQPAVKVAPQYVPEIPVYRLRHLIAHFATVPKILVTKPIQGLLFLTAGSLPLAIFAFLVRLLVTAPSGTSPIGLFFSSIALFFGLFFFIYSSKYYISILMVLKLASSGASGPTPNAPIKPINADLADSAQSVLNQPKSAKGVI